MWSQHVVILRPRRRGFHLVTDDITQGLGAALRETACGLVHLLLQHTSASLFLNENADPDVRRDMQTWSDRLAPDGAAWMVHDAEGPDDMPAHIKSACLGVALTLPISQGRLALGTWQGIWLGEHRDRADARRVLATIAGAGISGER